MMSNDEAFKVVDGEVLPPDTDVPPSRHNLASEGLRDDHSDIAYYSIGDQTKKPAETPHEIKKNIGEVVCGDCAQIMPCPHGDGKNTYGY